jgi:DNA polymerase-3 subunit alpha
LCGAFASIEEGQLASDHPDRLRDQKALMGALALQDVKADRSIDMSPFVKAEIAACYADLDEAHDNVVRPNFGKKPKFMVVTDCPTYFEEKEGLSMKGKSADYLKTSLKAAGLKVSDGYYTSLCKVKKKDKQLSNAEINAFSPTLEREIELLNPPVIIALGGGSIRHFYPDVKGGIADLTGRVEYDKERDCNVAFGINPQMIYPRPEMQEVLNELLVNVADMVL